MKSRQQAGFAHYAVVIVVVLFAVIGLASYKVLNAGKGKTPAASISASTAATAAAKQVPTITKAADVDKATQTLDDTTVDKDLDTTALDNDVNAVL